MSQLSATASDLLKVSELTELDHFGIDEEIKVPSTIINKETRADLEKKLNFGSKKRPRLILSRVDHEDI